MVFPSVAAEENWKVADSRFCSLGDHLSTFDRFRDAPQMATFGRLTDKRRPGPTGLHEETEPGRHRPSGRSSPHSYWRASRIRCTSSIRLIMGNLRCSPNRASPCEQHDRRKCDHERQFDDSLNQMVSGHQQVFLRFAVALVPGGKVARLRVRRPESDEIESLGAGLYQRNSDLQQRLFDGV